MPTDAFKKRVRARMAETGERYTTARAALLKERPTMKKPGEPTKAVVEPGGACPCGAPLPWHLLEVAGEKLTHHCRRIDGLGKGCGRTWRGTEDGKFREVAL